MTGRPLIKVGFLPYCSQILYFGFDFFCLQLAEQNTSFVFHRVQMWRFLTGVNPPPQKKAKLSETHATRQEPQKTWKDLRPWLQFTPNGMMISTGQPRIHQGNQTHSFGCPAFEIGTTWIFFNFEHCYPFKTRHKS